MDKHLVFKISFIEKLINRLRLFILYLLLPFEFYARFLKAKLKAQQGIIITDRYPLPKNDFYRYKNHSFQKFYKTLSLKLTHFLLPQPYLLFILAGDPKTIWERKKKSSYESFLVEYNRCLKSQELFKSKSFLIKTDCELDETFKQIVKILSSHFDIYEPA